MIKRVVWLLQSHSRKQTQKHMFSKYMYFNFAKYRLFNQLVDYEDGEGGRGSDDFFSSIYLFFIWSIHSFVIEQWTTHCLDFWNPDQLLIPLLKGQITAIWHWKCWYIFNNCKWNLLSISPSFGLVFDASRC